MNATKAQQVFYELTPSACLKRVARDVTTRLRRDLYRLAICGGRSIQGLGEALCAAKEELPIANFSLLRLFQTDAYVPTAERPDDNWDVMHAEVVEPLVKADLIREQQACRWNVAKGSPEEIVLNYSAYVPPGSDRFNGAIFGIGGGSFPDGTPDAGHIAGIFPGQERAWDVIDPFLYIDCALKPPQHRFTMSAWHIQHLNDAWGLLFGAEKANVRPLLESDSAAIECPARLILQSPHGVILTDIA